MPELSCVQSIRFILNRLAVVKPSHGILFFLHPGYILPDTVNPCERGISAAFFDAPNSRKHSMVKAYNGLNGITRPHGIDVTRLFGSPQIRRLSADQRTYKLHCIEHPTKDTGKDAS